MRGASVLRIATAVALLGATLWWAGPANVWNAARQAQWQWIAAALMLVAIDRGLNAYRWIALLDPILGADRPPLRDILRVFFVSTYLGTFLPTSLGSDAVRMYAANKLNVPARDAFASVFVDRFLGIVSNLLMAIAGLLVARDLAEDPVIRAGLLGTAGVCLVAAALIFSRQAAKASTGIAQRLPGQRAGRIASSAVSALQQYATKRQTLALVLTASLGVQVLRVMQAYCLGRSLAIDLPLAAYFAFIPPILLVMLMPISFFGLGTSQVAFVALFSRAHVDRGDAFFLSVLFLALGVAGNLPGGILYAFGSSREARTP